MGAAGSVRRSQALMQAELERLRSKEMDLIEEHDKQQRTSELLHQAKVTQLEAENFELVESLRDATTKLSAQTDKWKKEQSKALSLLFSDLPLHMLQSKDLDAVRFETNSMMTRTFQKVVVARCDVVGFSTLSTRLLPQQVIHIIDRLHAIIDEAFTDSNIFIMERTSDGCTAVSGLTNYQEENPALLATPLSVTDSSHYGSEVDIDNKTESSRKENFENVTKLETQSPNYYAGNLATAALNLLSYSAKIRVPLPENQTLQLRIALHSGPCSAGVIGLQNTTGVSRVPHYKLFGVTMKHLHTLCSSSLALQIRVSKQCRDLLVNAGGFILERCPDYMMMSNQNPVESYWLVAKEDHPLKLPSLDDAIPLCDYDDTLEP